MVTDQYRQKGARCHHNHWLGVVVCACYQATLVSINTIIVQASPDIQTRPYIKNKQQKVAGRVTQGHLLRKYKVLSLTASMLKIIFFCVLY
jgi:hypothetical protein